MELTVVIIEDDPRYRSSLETLFKHAPGFALAGSFGSARPALDEVDRLAKAGRKPPWKIVLMDLELPDIGGIDATRQMKIRLPDLAVVVLTVFENPDTILDAISAGADGYLLKKTPAVELLSQLQVIIGGGAPLTAGVARTVLDLVRATHASRSSGAPAKFDLTAREQEVLQCLVRGLSYKQAADDLKLSIDTVRSHIRGMYKKLQVHSATEAVSRALRQKLV